MQKRIKSWNLSITFWITDMEWDMISFCLTKNQMKLPIYSKIRFKKQKVGDGRKTSETQKQKDI